MPPKQARCQVRKTSKTCVKPLDDGSVPCAWDNVNNLCQSKVVRSPKKKRVAKAKSPSPIPIPNRSRESREREERLFKTLCAKNEKGKYATGIKTSLKQLAYHQGIHTTTADSIDTLCDKLDRHFFKNRRQTSTDENNHVSLTEAVHFTEAKAAEQMPSRSTLLKTKTIADFERALAAEFEMLKAADIQTSSMRSNYEDSKGQIMQTYAYVRDLHTYLSMRNFLRREYQCEKAALSTNSANAAFVIVSSKGQRYIHKLQIKGSSDSIMNDAYINAYINATLPNDKHLMTIRDIGMSCVSGKWIVPFNLPFQTDPFQIFYSQKGPSTLLQASHAQNMQVELLPKKSSKKVQRFLKDLYNSHTDGTYQRIKQVVPSVTVEMLNGVPVADFFANPFGAADKLKSWKVTDFMYMLLDFAAFMIQHREMGLVHNDGHFKNLFISASPGRVGDSFDDYYYRDGACIALIDYGRMYCSPTNESDAERLQLSMVKTIVQLDSFMYTNWFMHRNEPGVKQVGSINTSRSYQEMIRARPLDACKRMDQYIYNFENCYTPSLGDRVFWHHPSFVQPENKKYIFLFDLSMIVNNVYGRYVNMDKTTVMTPVFIETIRRHLHTIQPIHIFGLLVYLAEIWKIIYTDIVKKYGYHESDHFSASGYFIITYIGGRKSLDMMIESELFHKNKTSIDAAIDLLVDVHKRVEAAPIPPAGPVIGGTLSRRAYSVPVTRKSLERVKSFMDFEYRSNGKGEEVVYRNDKPLVYETELVDIHGNVITTTQMVISRPEKPVKSTPSERAKSI
jgi:hypothetical protein